MVMKSIDFLRWNVWVCSAGELLRPEEVLANGMETLVWVVGKASDEYGYSLEVGGSKSFQEMGPFRILEKLFTSGTNLL